MSQRVQSVGAVALVAATFFALGVVARQSLPFGQAKAVRTVGDFHELFYNAGKTTWGGSRWFGVPIEKCPMDLMSYQEILFDTRPDVLVEAGTFMGGSALYFASIMDWLRKGRVITIDIVNRGRPPHPRITYLQGSSTAPEIIAAVKGLISPGETVMAVLDSDHSYAHVLKELQAYGPLVTEGAYLVVEDTNINGHPVRPDYGPGPSEAVDAFCESDSQFVRDRTREKYLLTFNPGGFLRKIR